MCDENGSIIDGDQIIAMLAEDGSLKNFERRSNRNFNVELWFRNIFKNSKYKIFRSKVGDRYVKEKMKKMNFNLGGEQSGHIILGKFATTGDGLLVALEVLFSLRKNKKQYTSECF